MLSPLPSMGIAGVRLARTVAAAAAAAAQQNNTGNARATSASKQPVYCCERSSGRRHAKRPCAEAREDGIVARQRASASESTRGEWWGQGGEPEQRVPLSREVAVASAALPTVAFWSCERAHFAWPPLAVR
ncbi:hypothetical protein R5R35_010078 [Gryllus longicercus]|uniref:Uncharacterized protein n=1 Tax=Gryllus longicercus TaxID=2509291 RepID=A0AAN9V0Y5_9ORTH